MKCSVCGQPATHNEGGVRLVCDKCCQWQQEEQDLAQWPLCSICRMPEIDRKSHHHACE